MDANHPPTPLEERHRASPHPPLGNLYLAAAMAVVGAAIGSYISKILPVYIPVIPGFCVGYAFAKICTQRSNLITVLAAVIAFVGAVFCESICYTHGEGITGYMLQFYKNASGMDWIFRALNVGIAYWYTRDIGIAYVSAPRSVICSHCGQETVAGNKFCGRCGQALDED